MLKNILGNKDQNKEVDDKELKKLREQFKQLAQDSNSDNTQNNQQSPQQPAQEAPQQGSQAPNQQAPAGENNQNFVNADPQRVEENERVTNLIMQQIKELIEIDNNLNVKIKEMETKLKNNMSATQDIKQVVDKFHQRLEFIEKNMEKFMGLYEVVTNRFNPFVEEEQKQQMDNPQASGNPSIPDVTLSENSDGQTENQAQQSTDTNNLTQNAQSKQDDYQEKQTAPKSEPNAVESKPQTSPASQGAKVVEAAGVKGKLDSEPENVLIQSIDNLLGSNSLDEKAMEKLKAEVGKTVNSIVVEAIKGHRKVTTDEVQTIMQNIHSNLGLSETENQQAQPQQQTESQTAKDNSTAQNAEQSAQANVGQQPEQSANDGVQAANQQQENPSQVNEQETIGENQPGQQANAQDNQAQQNQETQQDAKQSSAEQQVPADYHFTLPDGTEIKSIADLRNALLNMDENTFAQHVNEQGNDFGQWLGLATGNQELAEKFAALKNRDEMVSELDKL